MLFRKRGDRVPIKSTADLEAMRRAGRLAARALRQLCEAAKPGVTTQELDDLNAAFAAEHGAKQAPLGYKGFPRGICTSINHVICHGIPTEHDVLRQGDIVGIDVTLVFGGFHGDTAATVPVGSVSKRARKLLHASLEATRRGICAVRPGATLGDVGWAVQRFAEGRGYGVVRDFVGHGTGRKFHEPPQVAHIGVPGQGTKLRPGMVFTIEPMLNEGTWRARVLGDGWTAVTLDGRLSSQFEHTIAVTETGAEVLTALDGDGGWEPPGGGLPW